MLASRGRLSSAVLWPEHDAPLPLIRPLQHHSGHRHRALDQYWHINGAQVLSRLRRCHNIAVIIRGINMFLPMLRIRHAVAEEMVEMAI